MTIHANGAEMNIANGIREYAGGYPRALALNDGSRNMTFGELNERTNRVAQILLSAGLTPGDRVAVLVRNRIEFQEIMAGIARAGMVSVPMNPTLTERELTYILAHSNSRFLLLDNAMAAAAAAAVKEVELRHVLSIDGTDLGPSYEAALEAARPADPGIVVSEASPFTCCYTSGTTGRPKGALISHRSRVLTFFLACLDFGLGPNRRTIAVAPLFLGAGFAYGFGPVNAGTSILVMREFDPERLLAMIDDFRPHSIFLTPAHLQRLRSLPEGSIQKHDLRTLETLFISAAPWPVESKLWAADAFAGVAFHEMYGSTEGGIVTTLRPPDVIRKADTVGTPWHMTEVRILDSLTHEPVEPGKPGELFSRSPMLFNGYLDDPAATADVTTPDGFFTAGDVAVWDDEGFIHVVDRVKDMIITGGINVYSREVEDVLLAHPGVMDAAVVGMPDPAWGEIVVAVVVARDGALTQGDVTAHCRHALAPYKVPKEVVFVASLPRNALGKVMKRELRDARLGRP